MLAGGVALGIVRASLSFTTHVDLPSDLDHDDGTRPTRGGPSLITMPTVDDDLPSGLGPEQFSARIFGSAGPATGGGLDLAPFRGVRFVPERAGDLAEVTTPPYDLVDDAEVGRLLSGGGHNIVRLNMPRSAGESYREAGETLRRWLAEGVLTTDPEVCHDGYQSTHTRPPQDGSNKPMNTRAHCAEPASQSDPRGAENAPANRPAPPGYHSPVVASYDPATTKLTWGGHVAPRVADPGSPVPATLGKESWKWLLLQPLLH